MQCHFARDLGQRFHEEVRCTHPRLDGPERMLDRLAPPAQVYGGTLRGREIEMRTDRELCWSCETLLPRIALQLGNPVVRIIDGAGMLWILRDGIWIEGSRK